MTKPYSLAAEPWLPVATKNGKRIFIPIRDISRPDLLRIDTGRADCDISLTEFLIGLLAISMGPSGVRDWVKRYDTPPSPDEIDEAIKPFADALALDGDGPRFFQDLDPLEDGETEPVASLFMDAPAGHFVKEGTVLALSRPAAAIALLTLQTSAPEGGRGHFTSLRGGGPSTTLIIPRKKDVTPTLWRILWANVPDGYKISTSEAEKVMPWLLPTRTYAGGRQTTPQDTHKAQAFFGMPRRLRLHFTTGHGKPCALIGITDGMIVQTYATRPHGTKYPTETWQHPLSPYYRKNENSNEWWPLHLKSSRVGYRDWVGLTISTANSVSRPADSVFTFIRQRARTIGIDFVKDQPAIFAGGYAMKSMKPLDFTEAVLPLISTENEERDFHLAGCANNMVAGAEIAASLLLSALKVALYSDRKQGQPDNTSAPLAGARARFWADTETAFYDALGGIVRDASDDPSGAIYIEAREAWRKTVRGAALGIFDDLAPIDSPESPDIKNIVNARRQLFFGLEGQAIFKALNLSMPEKREKKIKTDGKGRKAA